MKKYIHLTISLLTIINYSFAQTPGVNQMVIMTNKQSSTQEIADGVKPVLASTSDGWTPFISQNMDEIWQSIHLQGVNYYSMGEPAAGNSFSERSNFKSKFYQAWFGNYVIDAQNQLFDFPNDEINSDKKRVIDLLMQIGILDQSSWLYAMGDQDASHSTTLADSASNYSVLDHLSIDGQTAPVIIFSLNSHSDVNDSATQLSGLVGRPDKSYWQPALNANHNMVITGFFIYWYNKTDQTLKIIYGTGCSFATKDKTVYNTYPLIKNGMLLMAKQLKWVSVH